jgi:hypothetical protein
MWRWFEFQSAEQYGNTDLTQLYLRTITIYKRVKWSVKCT